MDRQEAAATHPVANAMFDASYMSPKGMLTFVSNVMSIDKVTSFVTSGDKPIPIPKALVSY